MRTSPTTHTPHAPGAREEPPRSPPLAGRGNGDVPHVAFAPERRRAQDFPKKYTSRVRLRNGRTVLLRPLVPADEPLMRAFHAHLSEHTVYLRYFCALSLGQRTGHERLARVCFNDFDHEIALAALAGVRAGAHGEIVAVGRLSRSLADAGEAEFALLVEDEWQGHGLGTVLLRRLLEIGGHEGIRRIIGHILPANGEMRRICRKLGFRLQEDAQAGEFLAIFETGESATTRKLQP